MSKKLEIDIDSTALGRAGCIKDFFLTVCGSISYDDTLFPIAIEGGYKSISSASMMYGVAVHEFIDVMFKTSGDFKVAREEALKKFSLPKVLTNVKQSYLMDERHLLSTCYNLWTGHIEDEPTFDVLSIPQECFYCAGVGGPCKHCNDKGIVEGPATEVTFRIKIYEDEFIIINLCGTIDNIGKFKNGCYAIRDWKTTSSWRNDYLSQYEMSRQLRIYTIACKLMAKSNPDSILGKIGVTKMGAFIDAIFVKTNSNDNEVVRGDVMQFNDNDLDDFMCMLESFCVKLSQHIQANYFPKEGILNGACTKMYGKCNFWNVCKNNDMVANVLLKRDFKRVVYNPLSFNEE